MRIGIDLGTTNSLVSAWIDHEARLIPNALGELLTPSAVSIGKQGVVMVGRSALERQTVDPQSTATSFKRFMGTDRRVELGSGKYTPEELSSLVLRSLKADAEAHLGVEITSAVITVPAYFNDRQRKATRRAGELAGLTVERLINEPTAAALAFGIQDREEREPFLVFDLGGGTFDVSIVEIYDGIMEVRASAGDNRLGGDDFNDALVTLARPRLAIPEKVARRQPLLLAERLRAAAETARQALTGADHATLAVTLDDQSYRCEIEASEFETQVAGLVSRLRDPVLRALRDSRIRAEELSDIVLVGGATRMPVVRKAITTMFGRFPNHRVHPDQAVALGAAVQAGLLSRDAALDEIRMTDICPYTLGIEEAVFDHQGRMQGTQFSPIIERNTPIPASRSRNYSTIQDNQREVKVRVFQGESRRISEDVELGDIAVSVPPRPAGQVSIDVRFSYDTSGILEVDVSVPITGQSHNLVIVDDPSAMNPEELQRRREALAALKKHPREDEEILLLLNRAERCYEEFIGAQRDHIGERIRNFSEVVDGQDPRAIALAREEFSRALDQIEQERFL
jgi:molecular chaperone HscC